jgi:hypothetical protein
MHGDGGDFRGFVVGQPDGSAAWRIERVTTGEVVGRGDAQSVSAGMDQADAALGRVRGNSWSSR